MKAVKLNNKGLTAIEILVCFVLMVVIVVSMYGAVNSYKNKQNIESDRDKIVTYKNLLTKEIQDDLIKKGLINVNILEGDLSTSGGDRKYTVELTFKDATKKILEVKSYFARDYGLCSTSDAVCENDQDDILLIGYGSAPGAADYVEYPLPDLGYGYNGNKYSTNPNCSGNNGGEKKGCKIYDFRINNVIVSTENNIFNFYVGFYHPDLGTRYGINIICPISFDVSFPAKTGNMGADAVYENLVSLIFRDNPSVRNNPTLNKSAFSTAENGLFSSNSTNTGAATYFFRGDVNNNYVKFAGILWRIVRINEDNSIRLISEYPIDSIQHEFASFGTTFDKMYYSNSDSVKNKIDSWYNNTLSSYDSWLVSQQYCQSFKVYHYPNNSRDDQYKAGNVTPKKYTEYSPTFKCINDANGYGILNSKVGLLSYDEVVYAGGYPKDKNINSYFDSSSKTAFWLMSPGGIRSDSDVRDFPIVHIWFHSDGELLNGFVENARCVIRPVINLNSSIKSLNTCNGTYYNPYIAEL